MPAMRTEMINPEIRPKVRTVFFMKSQCGAARRMSSSFWMISGQKAEFFAALHRLSAARSSELVEGAGAVGLYGVLGDEELSGDLAIAEAARDQGQDFELAGRDAEAPLLRCIG